MKYSVGICIGASTVSFVKLSKDNAGILKIDNVLTLPHNGSPKSLFLDSFKDFNPEKYSSVLTGRKFRNIIDLTSIPEPEATELAFGFMQIKYNSNGHDLRNVSAIASLGAETFMVYTLDEEKKISNLIARNQCASGTGEFFLQQIKRMDIDLDEVLKISKDAEPFKVSGRCSVFCKSDCTHALNKGTLKSEVASGLSLMIADKVEELLESVRNDKILMVGGVTLNYLVMDFLSKKINNLVIPDEAPYFEALGAAIYAMDNKVKTIDSFDNLFISKDHSFVFHPPLNNFKDKVKFCESAPGIPQDGDKCIVGLDVGSTTTKAVLMRQSDNAILAKVYLYTLGNPVKAAKECYSELLKQVPQNIEIIGLGTTGSGRHIAGLHALTTEIINEIIAHASAAVYFDPGVETIYEIGGQDAKYTFIVNKVPSDYAMNEACSAGTGSFIEETASESLGIHVTEIEAIAMKGQNPPNFSDQCSTFISSDIKTALHENISKEDIVAGLVYSICLNYINRVKGTRQSGEKIFMQGGVCYNKAIPIAMAALTGSEIIVPPDPGLMGAFGVALEIKTKIELGLLQEKPYSLKELSERDVTYKKPFICNGRKENCDRKCSVNLIQILGKNYPFGGACNKYYNLVYHNNLDADNYDYIKKRHHLTFEKYAPASHLPETAKTVGLNQSFHIHTIYPLYYNFFTKLGFNVVLSDNVEEAQQRELTSFCYPCRLSIGLFQNLLNKKPDYYFVPQVLEMYVGDNENHRMDFNSSCAFVAEEPLFLKQAFKDYNLNGQFIMPVLSFAQGFGTQEQKFISIANQLGIKDVNKIKDAYKFAALIQEEYQKELFSTGEEFLQMLDQNPDAIGMILFGRPYNAYTGLANKGIPQKFASRGVYVLPYDMFDYRNEIVDDEQFWEGSKKILKAAKIVQRHPRLFGAYISNFSCAPDSMIIPQFRKIMDSKPSLTLELDGHTADAGINTRIDAVLDIIHNYLKIKNRVEKKKENFVPASLQFSPGETYFISSDNEKVLLTDKRVVILIPSIGDLSANLFAAGMRSQGFNAIALPEGNNDILKYGRANATGKECLPLILCAGSLLDYLDNKRDPESFVLFLLVQGAGNCRLGQYPAFLRNLIIRKRLENVAILPLMNEDGFAGLGPKFALRGVQTLLAADVLDDIRSGIMAHALNPVEGIEIFNNEFELLKNAVVTNPDKIFRSLNTFAKNIKTRVPSAKNIKDAKYIALVGEIFVRRDHFSHNYLNKQFAEKGFILKDAYLTEWLFYIDYLLKLELLEPDSSFKKKYERNIRILYMRYAEYRIKKILEKSGYYKYSRTDIDSLLKHSNHIIPMECKGEPGLTLGVALHETIEKYCGVVNLGPFGCMPTRFSEAVTVPEMTIKNKIYAKKLNNPSYELSPIFNEKMNIPFLTIETDGNVYPQAAEAKIETFLMQAEKTHRLMQQVKK
jgi:predicted CoA-substrate-specific enzyme activase